LPWKKKSRAGRFLYAGLQLVNGNYARLLVDNYLAVEGIGENGVGEIMLYKPRNGNIIVAVYALLTL